MAREGVIVSKSGPLYLVGTRAEGVIVDTDRGVTSPMINTQSIFAHVPVVERWADVADRAGLPSLVKKAIEAFNADN
jgi:hypothetical protein